MAFEAGRSALAAAGGGVHPDLLIAATTNPPYLDKTNATVVHAALRLPDECGAWDAGDFERQQRKLVAAITELDASVVGLMEIENSAALGETPDEATSSLVDALNTAAGEDR